MVLLLYLTFIGKTFFLLDLFVQTIGYHIQHLPQLSLHSDAFVRANFDKAGKGSPAGLSFRYTDPTNSANIITNDKNLRFADYENWMGDWTVCDFVFIVTLMVFF